MYIDGRNGGKLTPFQPGNPGGPGRPKGGKALTKQRIGKFFNATTRVFNELTGQDEEMTLQDQMIAAMVRQGIKGDVAAFSVLHDRYEGKPTQHLGADPDSPIMPNSFENWTPEQLREMMAAAPVDIHVTPKENNNDNVQDVEWEPA